MSPASAPARAAAADAVSRDAWADVLRILATGGVVLLHTAALWVDQYASLPRDHWMAANLWDAATRVCVPWFLMLSGWLLLPRQETPGAFLRTRLPRLLLPLLAWSLLYLLWTGWHTDAGWPGWRAVLAIAGAPAHYHLWFLYTLVGLYLGIPLLRVLVAHAGERLLWYAVLLWFLAASVLPLLAKLSGQPLTFGLQPHAGLGGYLLLGVLLGRRTTDVRTATACAVLALAGSLFTGLATWWFTVRSGQVAVYFYDWLSPNVIGTAACGWLALQHVFAGATLRPSASREELSRCCFGIYLVHPLWLAILQGGTALPSLPLHPALGIPVWAGCVFGASLLSIFLLRRVPVLRWMAP